MPSFLAYFAPLALLFPIAADLPAGDAPVADGAKLLPEPAEKEAPRGKARPEGRMEPPGWIMLDATTSIPTQNQVRIERRVIVRISPRSNASRQELVATLGQQESAQQFIERKAGNCIPVSSIAAVQAMRDNRLMLYTRDRKMLAASLEKSCRARDFYSGFYVEPNGDGQICISRDKLQSRTGAKCEISGFRQVTPVTPQ